MVKSSPRDMAQPELFDANVLLGPQAQRPPGANERELIWETISRIGRVLLAPIPEADKRAILGENLAALLATRKG